MLEIPSRTRLAALTNAINAVIGSLAVGFAKRVDEDRVAVLYCYQNGIAKYIFPVASVPEALRPSSFESSRFEVAVPGSEATDAIDWILRSSGVGIVVSVRLSIEPTGRFWVGLPDKSSPTTEQTARLEGIADEYAGMLQAPAAPDDPAERLRRLELAQELLPTLVRVLDVREVFDRLSTIAKPALPHDVLMLGLLSNDLSTISVVARSDQGPSIGPALPYTRPVSVTRAWVFDIVDDLAVHPLETDRPAARLGARSSLRLPIRFGDDIIGGLGFLSLEPAKYTSADVVIGRRLADQVAVGLSHQRLAEESRRSAVLLERAHNLEMLEELLATLAGVLDIREVFARVSVIADKVLPHDAMSIVEIIDNGQRARFHASYGLGDLPQPFDVPVPDPALVEESWDFRVIDDLTMVPSFARSPGLVVGMRSMMLVAIRVGGRLYGGLNFYSRAIGRYVQDDVMVARRIADHVALALSHRELADQARRNEELRTRTEKSDLLDALLAALIDSGDLPVVFDRLSAIARKVLPHDALMLMVRLPDNRRARTYATSGMPAGLPEIIEVPEELQDESTEYDIFDDAARVAAARKSPLSRMGFGSLLRIPIRLDGRFAGGLFFLSKEKAAFSQAEVPVARRVADRLAVTLARDRELKASKRAAEATARASKLEARVRSLTEELDARTGYRRVIGESREWRQVLTQATQVAPTETTVLLLGESGTGKEVVARLLHRASARSNGPFIALNCAALPEQLLEAELFGYERGAYTGATQSKPGQLEQAAGGTLFLDEVAEMSPSAQAKFLRVLQEREFQRLGGTRVLRTDARVVAATNRDLERAIANGQFREDLYYRLNVFAIRLPRLRDRKEDILPLSEAFLGEMGRSLGRPPAGISRDARQVLIEYHWPGNVRELRNILERAAILCDGGLITAEHLAVSPSISPASAPTGETPALGRTAPQARTAGDLHAVERAMIEQALQSARFNKSKAAKALGLTRHQLYIRMRKHGLEP